MCDLYPREEWNFVYGMARLTARVGVFSFIRHTPGNAPAAWREASMLHSSMKTMLHEIGHMFGMKHCTWFNCLMRGSNGAMVEHQRNYLHLCPVCLHKLHWSTGVHIPAQYSGMLEICQPFEGSNADFKKDCEFLRARLAALEDLQLPGSAKEQHVNATSARNRHAPDDRSNASRRASADMTSKNTVRSDSVAGTQRSNGQTAAALTRNRASTPTNVLRLPRNATCATTTNLLKDVGASMLQTTSRS